MTREEAIGNLIHAIRWNDMPKKESLDMAIKALEQEPCDAVSRKARYQMQIVIDIPDEEYECVKITGFIGNKTCISNAIYNGILLPKNHGRLIDADYLKDVSLLHNNHVTNKYLVPYKDRNGYRMRDREVMEALINAETIIEADGGDAE